MSFAEWLFVREILPASVDSILIVRKMIPNDKIEIHNFILKMLVACTLEGLNQLINPSNKRYQ